MPDEEKKQYRLVLGAHNGTLVSRYSTEEYHDTEEECHEAFRDFKKYLSTTGYKLWCASIWNPEGEKIWHSNGYPYR